MMNEMLKIEGLRSGYSKDPILDDISLSINKGELISIIGPNGCGKSTLLKSLNGNLKKMGGCIYLDGSEIQKYTPKQLAQRMSVLSQVNISPDDMTVERLVKFGRVPYQNWFFSPMSDEDKRIVEDAMESTGIIGYRERTLTSLSGGERQRVWIAMSLAQQPELFLLDEPTTYLDICYQFEIMELLKHLNETRHMTIVMVLHDLNQAVKYSDRLVIMKKGRIYNIGDPGDTVNEQMLRDVFSLECTINRDEKGNMAVIPTGFVKERKLKLNK